MVGLKHREPEMNINMKEQILRMKDMLIKVRGFLDDNITLLIEDDEEEPYKTKNLFIC